jgi:hypothetical protein
MRRSRLDGDVVNVVNPPRRTVPPASAVPVKQDDPHRHQPPSQATGGATWPVGARASLTDAIRDGGIVVLEDAVRDLVDGRDHLRKSRALGAAVRCGHVRSFVPPAVPSGREEREGRRRWPARMMRSPERSEPRNTCAKCQIGNEKSPARRIAIIASWMSRVACRMAYGRVNVSWHAGTKGLGLGSGPWRPQATTLAA